MTAAYMTRCVYLTFFGEYRGGAHERERTSRVPPTATTAEHDLADAQDDDVPGFGAHADAHAHGPHESNRLLTGPLWVLSFFAVFAGLPRTSPQLRRTFTDWFEPTRRVRRGASTRSST